MALKEMVETFNREFANHCHPLTARQLKNWPKGLGQKMSSTAEYAFFWRDERGLLAVSATSKFAGHRYVEIAESGEIEFDWCDGDMGVIVDGEEAERRMREAGLLSMCDEESRLMLGVSPLPGKKAH